MLESFKTELLYWNIAKNFRPNDVEIGVNESMEREKERVILNPNVTVPRGRPRINHLRPSNEHDHRNSRRRNCGKHASNDQV